MKKYYLCLGPEEKQFFDLPEKWEVAHFVESEGGAPSLPVREMAARALAAPEGAPPLRDLAAKAKKVALIVDDKTRPTPTAGILEVLLPELTGSGLKPEEITIVIALGTHVPLDQKEIEAKLGISVAARYRVVQHNAWQEDLVPIMLPAGDGVVRINPAVVAADLRIGVSSILPHPMAGYGGGPKILMPGVSNFEFIRDHHMKYTIDPRARAGLTRTNPFHEACMRIARTIGLDFSVNCVYDQQARLVSIIGGSLEGAFSRSVEASFEKLGHGFDEKVDIAITSTYPHTHGIQFSKGLAGPEMVTKETGAILVAAPLVTPVMDEFVAAFDLVKERSGGNGPRFVREAMSKGLPFLPEKPVEFNMAMSCMILRPPIRTLLVCPLVSQKQANTMGLDHAPSLDAGLERLAAAYPKAKVAIFPSGGLIVPVLKGSV